MATSIAEYFDGNVKSLANVRHGARFSVGIIAFFIFGTGLSLFVDPFGVIANCIWAPVKHSLGWTLKRRHSVNFFGDYSFVDQETEETVAKELCHVDLRFAFASDSK